MFDHALRGQREDRSNGFDDARLRDARRAARLYHDRNRVGHADRIAQVIGETKPGMRVALLLDLLGRQIEVEAPISSLGFTRSVIPADGPEAMKRFDKFYTYLTEKCGLGKRPVLEGLSRGGLPIFNWSIKNPSKVSCVYADNAVCDFKSWPGGKGKGKGSAGLWKSILKKYNF